MTSPRVGKVNWINEQEAKTQKLKCIGRPKLLSLQVNSGKIVWYRKEKSKITKEGKFQFTRTLPREVCCTRIEEGQQGKTYERMLHGPDNFIWKGGCGELNEAFKRSTIQGQSVILATVGFLFITKNKIPGRDAYVQLHKYRTHRFIKIRNKLPGANISCYILVKF